MRQARTLIMAGMVAPVLFATMVILQSLFRSDHLPLAWPISALAAGAYGWIQSVNFAVTGSLLVLFAVGLHRAIAPGGTGIWGPTMVGLSGVGMLWAAAFPLGDYSSSFDPQGERGLHPIGAVLHFGVGALGLIVLRWRLRLDPQWKGLAPYCLMTGMVGIVYFVVMGALVMPDDAPLNPVGGLMQSILVVILHAAFFLLARRGSNVVQAEPVEPLEAPTVA